MAMGVEVIDNRGITVDRLKMAIRNSDLYNLGFRGSKATFRVFHTLAPLLGTTAIELMTFVKQNKIDLSVFYNDELNRRRMSFNNAAGEKSSLRSE